jgi:hypothetical protein
LALPLVDILGLKPAYNDLDDNADTIGICNPPHTRVPRGRLRKKRLDKANFRATKGVVERLRGGGCMGRPFEENKEAQMNAFVPADSAERETIAFLSRSPVDGENKPFDVWTGEERTAPLRGQRTGGRERAGSSRLPGHNPGSSLLGDANLMNGMATQASTSSPIQGSPSQVVPQLRSRRTDHSAGGGLQALSSIDRHLSSSYLTRAGPPVEIAAGSGISNNDTPHIPDRYSMFPPAEPGSSRNPWEDQSLAPVPIPDNALLLAGGGRFSSESNGFAPSMISPTLFRPLFGQSTHLNMGFVISSSTITTASFA